MGEAAAGELWTAAAAAAADRHTMDTLGMPSPVLMERAALCVSAEVEASARALARAHGVDPRRIPVLALCGPGNNGGDGFAVARQLHGRGWDARAVLVTESRNPAAEAQRTLAAAHGVPCAPRWPTQPEGLTLGVIVDAMLGTGSHGAPRGAIAEAVEWLSTLDPARFVVVAVDLPSGIDVDTGAVAGRAVTAARTVTFQRSKPGLHLTPARDHAGAVVVADIQLVADPDHPPSTLALIEPRAVAAALATLPEAAHKGRRGHVGVLGGTGGTPGAAILAGAAALRAGAGLATLGVDTPELRAMLIERRPELMIAQGPDAARVPAASVLVVGPGLTDPSEAARADIQAMNREDARPMVWDAGALDLLTPGAAAGPRVLTPHPGEAARLLARLEDDDTWTNARVQADRRSAAERLAERTQTIVVLKGAGTLVASPTSPTSPTSRQTLAVCTTGGPALATAGSGDVLAGTIAALLARGLDPWTAACAGVHIHGLAGDLTAPDGTIAMDIADALPSALAAARQHLPTPAWPRLRRG
ncbi:NAD(P)H-hydrate dehydratase [Pseudenhygromyxa sp. WMMC2535]|uniref:NAD(P)H-hydrate dehydratase n=1 Tax=Pseudenhygromyxa sp. WMMC2535 TaxID=2712867 RepID=UPI00155762FE|nr:NAD(P)H-hydrate dehydratase [Pseudenhygromyxa sp. WMMC2535]NVB41498.1 NAD(P)H-hydrate dehydratase [Pseudenhygromyxa sp. WMMC2535]